MNKFSLAFVAALLPAFAGAQTTSSGAFDRFMALTTGANTQTIGFASGTPIVTDTHSTGANLGNLNVTADPASKGLLVAGSGKLPVGTAGRTVPFTATGKIGAAQLGQAFGMLGGLAGGWPGVALMIGVPYVFDWMLKAAVKINADGTFSKADPSVCTVGPCYSYSVSRSSFAYDPANYSSSQSGACALNSAAMGLMYAGWSYPVVSSSGGCTVANMSGGANYGNSTFSYVTQTVAPKPPGALVPATLLEVQAQLATVQPDPWVLSELYNKAVLDNKIDLNIVAHGPSTVEGPAVTTVEPATATTPEKTTTTKTNYTCGYVLADVSCMEQKSKSSQLTGIDPATGQPYPKVDLGTTTKEPVPKTITCGLPDTPVCAVKVDETGVPNAQDVVTTSASDKYKPIKDFVDNPDSLGKPLPSINWAFALPSSCGVIPVGAFSEFLAPIDVCQFQPMFHQIMSMVWMLGGLFGAISLFMKSSLGDA